MATYQHIQSIDTHQDTFTNPKVLVYILVFITMSMSYFLLRGAHWEGGAHSTLQPMLELSAGLMTVAVGVAGMVRFYRVLSALQQANISANQSIRNRTMLLASTSHEIRNPAHVITGMTGLALKTELTNKQREYLEAIQLSGQDMITVLNQTLDLSRIESGNALLDYKAFNIADTVAHAVDTLAASAQSKGLELTYEVADDTPSNLMGDTGRLRQTITNLVENAVKFTDQGTISILVDAVPQVNERVLVHFAIADTGKGIPDTKLSDIFEPFTQVGDVEESGSGLGLAIAKELVELMDGQLWVESEEHKGSTFHFTARLTEVPAVEATPDGTHD